MFQIVLVLAVRFAAPDGFTVEKEFTIEDKTAYATMGECRADIPQRKWFAAGANRAIQFAESRGGEVKAINVRVKCFQST